MPDSRLQVRQPRRKPLFWTIFLSFVCHPTPCHAIVLYFVSVPLRVLTWCSKFDVLPNSRVRLVMAGTNAGQNIAAGEAGRLEHEEARNARIQAEQG